MDNKNGSDGMAMVGKGNTIFARFATAGLHRWECQEDGNYALMMVGGGGGCGLGSPGESGRYHEENIALSKGDILIFIIGEGGAGSDTGKGTDGGSTTFSRVTPD
jgi:hypothetical protein